jgi:hypothetical protein
LPYFGTTEFGSGNIQPTEPIQSAPYRRAAASSDDEILSRYRGAVVITSKKRHNLQNK